MTKGTLGPNAAEEALERATWQPVLLAPRPRRLDLLRLTPSWPLSPVRVHVLRNQPFELVEGSWGPFLAYAGLAASTVLGGYDDALTLVEVDQDADVHIVSLDFDRVAGDREPGELVGWLDQRMGVLRERTTAPVLVTDWASADTRAPVVNALLREVLPSRAAVQVVGVAALADDLGDDFYDDRAVEVRATRWSDAAVIAMTRAFATQWLPAVLAPPLKAVVVDLDETLYAGVLGEDGPGGVALTPGHAALQTHLRSLSESGVFVAVSSRNELADVERLFSERLDFPLRRSDLAVVVADWGDKAQHVATIADLLNISTDAVAFLDDNPGELAAVRTRLPGVRTLHAASAEASVAALRHCPGLFRFRTSIEDTLRVGDRVAGLARESEYRRAEDPMDYLRSLEVVISYRVDDPADVPRIAELSTKTNQFSTTLRRTPEAEIHRRLLAGEIRTVAVELSDRLSDSGTVAALVSRREGTTLVVEEVLISCRALGRGAEDALLAQALLLAADEDVTDITVEWVEGPRNGPARAWLGRLAGGALPQGSLPWAPDDLQRAVRLSPFTVRTGGAAHVG